MKTSLPICLQPQAMGRLFLYLLLIHWPVKNCVHDAHGIIFTYKTSYFRPFFFTFCTQIARHIKNFSNFAPVITFYAPPREHQLSWNEPGESASAFSVNEYTTNKNKQ
jgi:hypothetical protein